MRPLLLACLCVVCFTAGCTGPTGDPPPYPQPSFEYTYTQDGTETRLSITVVDDGGVSNQSIRILVDDTVAYENGSFRGPYVASRPDENEWADGVETGDTLVVTNGARFPPGANIEVEIRRRDTNEFVVVGSNETRFYEETATEPRSPETPAVDSPTASATLTRPAK